MAYFGNSGFVPSSLMGPEGANFNVNMADLQAFLQAQSQTALVPKGKGSKTKAKKANHAGILALGAPQLETALVPSTSRTLASATSSQGYDSNVDFSGALSVVKPKKAAKPKPPKFSLGLESNVNWPVVSIENPLSLFLTLGFT